MARKHRVLVIGKGGREHALVCAFKSTNDVESVWCWPGSAGIFLDATPLTDNQIITTSAELIDQVRRHEINLVVIGPEDYLVAGWADQLRNAGVKVFGPNQAAAQLEGSKSFAKDFMTEFGIPTAAAHRVSSIAEVAQLKNTLQFPIVFKADGLCAGKGVVICTNYAELEQTAQRIFVDQIHGAAGASALLEEFLNGTEASLHVVIQGQDWCALPMVQDHKTLYDHNHGPNTGGMGVCGPLALPKSEWQQIRTQIIEPTLTGLKKRGLDYQGVLFIGLMRTAQGPRVLEYNVRWGDPETQLLVMLDPLRLTQLIARAASGLNLNTRDFSALDILNVPAATYAVGVVMASANYPSTPSTGTPIPALADYEHGLRVNQNAESRAQPLGFADLRVVFHSGTSYQSDTGWVTQGGRVLTVMGRGASIGEARQQAYAIVTQLKWPGVQFRADIGQATSN